MSEIDRTGERVVIHSSDYIVDYPARGIVAGPAKHGDRGDWAVALENEGGQTLTFYGAELHTLSPAPTEAAQ